MPHAVDVPSPSYAGRETDVPKIKVTIGTPTILVVRHGSVTEGDKESGENKILRGSDIDDGLSAEGRAQARMAGNELAKSGATRLFSSNLKRGKETANIIGEATGLKPELLVGLKPWKVGPEIAGHTIKQVKKEVAYYQDHPKETPPGGEPYAKYYKYTDEAWKYLMKEAEHDARHPIIATAHSRDILALPNIISGKGPKGVPIEGAPANGSVSRLEKIGGSWRFKQAPAVEPHVGGPS